MRKNMRDLVESVAISAAGSVVAVAIWSAYNNRKKMLTWRF